MKNKHFQYVVFLVIFVVSLDFVVGTIYEKLYFSEKSIENDSLIHSVLGTNEDILIFGSSRALHHYNPKILEESLDMSCYNLGSGGQNIYYHLALLESTLERYTPKIAILELMSIDFEQTPPKWDTEKLGVLLPFASKSVSCKNAVMLRGKSEQLKLQSSIYPFNSLQYVSLRNNLFPLSNSYNGYIPLNRIYGDTLGSRVYNKKNVDEDKEKSIFKFVEICKLNNIELFIFISPHYVTQIHGSIYSEITTRLQEKYGVQVYNFESDSLFLSQVENFADPLHLNREGADKYTSIVTGFIKK